MLTTLLYRPGVVNNDYDAALLQQELTSVFIIEQSHGYKFIKI